MSIIRKIINESHREFHFVECTELGGAVCPLIRMNGYDAYLYDCGRNVDSLLSFFFDQNIAVKAVVESEKRWKKKCTHYGIPYISEDDLKQKCENPSKSIVIIASDSFYGIKQMSILGKIIQAGIDKIYAITKNDMITINGTTDETEWSREWYIREFADQFESTYNLLSDGCSKQVMEEWIRVFLGHRKWSLPEMDTRNKYFYDGSTVENRSDIYTHLSDEVWVNCGACLGDNILLYFDAGMDAKKIYAFEGEDVSYKKLKRGIELLSEELKSKIKPIKKYISLDTRFASYIDEPVTLVNADIQGNELDMLIAMKNIIVSDRPVLAICVYHKALDLVEIPKFINSIVDDYHFYLRKYAASAYSSTAAWELVLYAVPTERLP